MHSGTAWIIVLLFFIIVEYTLAYRHDIQLRNSRTQLRRRHREERTAQLNSQTGTFTPAQRAEIRDIVNEILDEERTEDRIPVLNSKIRNGVLMGALSGYILGGDSQSAFKGAVIWGAINGMITSTSFHI